jgi:hypothetical protein
MIMMITITDFDSLFLRANSTVGGANSRVTSIKHMKGEDQLGKLHFIIQAHKSNC